MGLKSENEDILVKSYKISEIKEKLKSNKILNGLANSFTMVFFKLFLRLSPNTSFVRLNKLLANQCHV